MENRFLEILGNEDVCVNLVSGIWRIEIPAHLLNSDESEMLEQNGICHRGIMVNIQEPF